MMVSLKPDIVRQSDEVGEGLNENGRFAKRLLGAPLLYGKRFWVFPGALFYSALAHG